MKTDQLASDLAGWKSASQLIDNGAPRSADANGPDAPAITAAQRAGWEPVIRRLTEWQQNPAVLDDDGLDPPSAELLGRALNFARAAQLAGYPAPTSLVPDPNGGIVFLRSLDQHSEEYHFWDDGTIDYCRFEGTRLVERRDIA